MTEEVVGGSKKRYEAKETWDVRNLESWEIGVVPDSPFVRTSIKRKTTVLRRSVPGES